MSDPFDPPAPEPAAFPWDEPPSDSDDPAALSAEALAEDTPRQRHDAFTQARKCAFLRALKKTGCVLDAARTIGVGARTIYRHQESDPVFAEHCRLAVAAAAMPLELSAWQRAVEGVEQPFACGGEVHVRRRYSDGLLRLLLLGSNPKKYGPRPGFTRKRLAKAERRHIEHEVRAEWKEKNRRWSFDEAIVELDKKLRALGGREDAKRLAAGWTKTPDGHWIPPGYGPLPGWPGEGVAETESGGAAAGDTPRDSM